MTCEFCGNDEGAYHACLDCMAVQPAAVMSALAEILGGTPMDWAFLAPDLTNAINNPRKEKTA